MKIFGAVKVINIALEAIFIAKKYIYKSDTNTITLPTDKLKLHP